MSASYLSNDGEDRSAIPMGALRRFTREREQTRKSVEHCELCSEMIPPDHHHLLDLSSRISDLRMSSLLSALQWSGYGRR